MDTFGSWNYNSNNMNLTDLSINFHRISTNAGWWKPGEQNDPKVIATKFALIHSEVSEAFEGYRKSAMDPHLPHRQAVEVELADVLIRVFDLAGALNLDLQAAVHEKSQYNLQRPDHKLEARSKKDGKKF